jgi:transposase
LLIYEIVKENESCNRNIGWSARPNKRMEPRYRTGLKLVFPKEREMKKKYIYVGVDLHKTQFTTCTKGLGITEGYDQFGTEPAGYERFVKQVKAWQGEGRTVVAGVESTGNTRYFKNQLERAGVEVRVINTLEFKVVNKSVKKTDRHDAATIAEFLAADMLPEAHLCSEDSEKLRRLLQGRTLAVRMAVAGKNQIHGLLTGLGMQDTKASLQSKKGRQRVLDALAGTDYELVVQPFMKMIEMTAEQVKGFEGEVRRLCEGDPVVELLRTIPGCGEITAWTIRAYVDDIGRFPSGKAFAAYAGLVPWVQSSNETVHMGKITKRGPRELRTALVQLVMGLLRQKRKTAGWRLMERYEGMKRNKGSGKSIVATARKLAVIIWTMLSRGEGFDVAQMTDGKLAAKAESMRKAGARRTEELAACAREEESGKEQGPGARKAEAPKSKQESALPKKKIKKRLVSS